MADVAIFPSYTWLTGNIAPWTVIRIRLWISETMKQILHSRFTVVVSRPSDLKTELMLFLCLYSERLDPIPNDQTATDSPEQV